jgi:hypothetical protein
LAIIAKQIIILNKEKTVPTLKSDEPVHLKVSAPPVVKVSSNVAILQHPDVVNKPSAYVASMFHSYK